MADKTAFYWAIIGDSNPEPVAVTGEPGNRMAYTIGCADPFPLDVPEPNIELIPNAPGREYDFDRGVYVERTAKPFEIPPTPKEYAAARAASEERLEAERKRGIRHGYAGFGARVTKDTPGA